VSKSGKERQSETIHGGFGLPEMMTIGLRTLSHPLIFEMTWVGKDDSAYPVS
jgi:hypothetical protein